MLAVVSMGQAAASPMAARPGHSFTTACLSLPHRTNMVMNYSDVESKVREATNDETWGPHGTLMAEIAKYTFTYEHYPEVMTMLWKRMFESRRNWRRTYKVIWGAGGRVGEGMGVGVAVVGGQGSTMSSVFDIIQWLHSCKHVFSLFAHTHTHTLSLARLFFCCTIWFAMAQSEWCPVLESISTT